MSTGVEILTEFNVRDLNDLCDATEAAILDGGGFGWVAPPPRHILEAYWQGVLLVPERTLFIARLEDVICGSAQLVRPTRNAEATAFAAQLTTFFLAPWARGHGLARNLVEAVENAAIDGGFDQINLDVRETQERAIQIYESLGYERWGTNPRYARVNGRMIVGYYYSKTLASD
ncbi:MAG: GNAT family N-acetyltransferase [Alphaproteobacteria bacterium]|nr:GNAT family N-acetyltransferase [Alphaproteobacteria bacterium]